MWVAVIALLLAFVAFLIAVVTAFRVSDLEKAINRFWHEFQDNRNDADKWSPF